MKKILMLSCLLTTSILQADEGAASRDYGFMQTIIMIGLAVLFFYFILLRPEQKRRKALDSLRTQMKVGDDVVAMGIVGKVHSIEEDHVILTMVDGSKIKVLKGAITDIAS